MIVTRDFLTVVVSALEKGQPCTICTVVETRGSTPQKAGAAMLVHPDGTQAGTLGGGCVEAEVKRRALLLSAGAEPEVMVFQLDHDYGWDDGLICGGRMTVLADPLPPTAVDYFRQIAALAESGRGGAEVLLTAAQDGCPVGARFLINDRRNVIASLRAAAPPADVLNHLPPALGRPKPVLLQNVAYLPIHPRIRLLIVGGGHVGQAVGAMAAQAEFDVWVLDDRDAYANRDRFPAAGRIIVGDIGRALPALADEGALAPTTFAIIVTRGHSHDEEALHHLARTNCGYVGLIGSKRKIRLIFDDLLAKGVPQATLDRVHAPLGLAIGSQTVPEIAVSIVAELIAFRNLGAVPTGMRQGRE